MMEDERPKPILWRVGVVAIGTYCAAHVAVVHGDWLTRIVLFPLAWFVGTMLSDWCHGVKR